MEDRAGAERGFGIGLKEHDGRSLEMVADGAADLTSTRAGTMYSVKPKVAPFLHAPLELPQLSCRWKSFGW